MTAKTEDRNPSVTTTGSHEDDIVRLPRRKIDKILVGFGLIAAIVFLVAGGLLTWGSTFSSDYVHDELASQNVFFPDKAALVKEGRDDLVSHAGEQVTSGKDAQVYAGYISGHLEVIGEGKTFSQIDDRGAAAAVVEATKSGASDTEVAKLQATADELKTQRDSLFRGETLRGLLLSTYAWSVIGTIAAIAAWVAFVGAVLMAGLTIAGALHIKRHSA